MSLVSLMKAENVRTRPVCYQECYCVFGRAVMEILGCGCIKIEKATVSSELVCNS